MMGKERPVLPADEVRYRMKIALREIGIPPRPKILTRIEEEMGKEEPDFHLLADLLRADVALAAGLIKTVNSPFYGLRQKVTSIRAAMTLLGLRQIAQAVAGLALREAFQHLPAMERFWDASAKIAGLTAWLAHHLKPRLHLAPEEAYTFALFRDCGIPTLMMPFEDYIAVLAQANAEQSRSFTDVEESLLGVNHALIGARLANDWGLPPGMVAAIRWHHDRAALAGESTPPLEAGSRHLMALAQVAEYLVQTHYGQTVSLEWNKLGASALADLGLDAAELPQLAAQARWRTAG